MMKSQAVKNSKRSKLSGSFKKIFSFSLFSDNDKPIKLNASYHSLPIANLLKLDYWEHVKPEILKQGRVIYFDGNKLRNFVDDDDDDKISEISSEKSDMHSNRGEVPVPLFASCSGDRLISDEMKPWSIQLSDIDDKLVLVQSLNWPGAYSFVKEKTCDHIYIGYGHKYWHRNYAPPMIPQLASEFLTGSDVVECDDPTVEDEIIFIKKRDDVALSDVEKDEVSQ